MGIRLLEDFSFTDGNMHDSDSESSCYVAGSFGYNYAFFGISTNLKIAVSDDNNIFASLDGGNASQDELTKGNAWPAYWATAKKEFAFAKAQDVLDFASTQKITDDVLPVVSSTYVGTCHFDIPFADLSNIGSSSNGWMHIGNISDSDLDTDHKTYFAFWIAFPILNVGGEVNLGWGKSRRVVINGDWVPKLFSYFPWARRINSDWWSHNRNGGRLSRHNGSGWQGVKNTQNSENDSKGRRHNNDGWVISPITGREA